MEKKFLSTWELSIRWGISRNTLKQWRWQGKGPRFFHISGRVSYLIEDVIEFEQSREMKKKKKNM